jgi:methyl-accepting chemotaxis protein
MFSSICGIIYYLLLEDLMLKIMNSNIFRNNAVLEERENFYYIKFRYILTYLLFLALFFISSLSGFITSQFGKSRSKELHHELVQNRISKLNQNTKEFIDGLENQVKAIQKTKTVDNIPKKSQEWKNLIQKEFLSDPLFMDIAIYNAKENMILYNENRMIPDEMESIKDMFNISSNNHFIYKSIRLTKGDPHRILVLVHPLEKDFYYIIFLNLYNFEQRFFSFPDVSNKNIFLFIDPNLQIVASSEPSLRFKNLDTLTKNTEFFSKDKEIIHTLFFNKSIYELYFEKVLSSGFYVANLYAKSLYQDKVSYTVATLSTTYLLIGIVFIFFITYIVNKKTQSLEIVNQALDLVSKGNFKKIKMFITNDEFGNVSLSLIKLKHNLRHTLKETIQLTNISKQFSQNFKSLTEHLVHDSENQAATTEQISASIEEISATMDKISEFANEQTYLINNLSKSIDELTTVIKEAQQNLKEIKSIINESEKLKSMSEKEILTMTDAMNQIQQTSTKITSIINIVKEIADQINLLSLNASIEAARAGEYGKGFAVVADEVSKLADKTMNSIKDINSLIKNSNEQIHYGIQVSSKVKNILTDMIQEFQNINQLSQKISEVIIKQEFVNTGVLSQTRSVVQKSNEIQSNIMEQKMAIKEITESIASINKTILTSTENARRINTKATELERKIQELENLLKEFQLGE